MIPIDDGALEECILAKSPGSVASLLKADADLRDGRAISLDEFLARNPVRRAPLEAKRGGRRAPRKG